MFGFTGSRKISSQSAALISKVVSACTGELVTGCASGADQLVRSAGGERVRVFRASDFCAEGLPVVASLVARSVAMVGTVSRAGGVLIGFPSSACPPSVRPSSSSSVCFCGAGAGTWSTLALAVGLRVRVVVFACGSFVLPAWGAWQRAPGRLGQLGGFVLVRPVQNRLFD